MVTRLIEFCLRPPQVASDAEEASALLLFETLAKAAVAEAPAIVATLQVFVGWKHDGAAVPPGQSVSPSTLENLAAQLMSHGSGDTTSSVPGAPSVPLRSSRDGNLSSLPLSAPPSVIKPDEGSFVSAQERTVEARYTQLSVAIRGVSPLTMCTMQAAAGITGCRPSDLEYAY
jgi:hypothetical protein